MTKIADVARRSQQIGARARPGAADARGSSRRELQQQLTGLARQEQQTSTARAGSRRPGRCATSTRRLIEALAVPRQRPAGLANALAATATSKNTHQAAGAARRADAAAARERRHLGRLVQGPADDGARQGEGERNGVPRPDSDFVQNPDFVTRERDGDRLAAPPRRASTPAAARRAAGTGIVLDEGAAGRERS